jgi:DNA replication and repair protein RecF
VPGGSEDADVARRELAARRERDAHRPSASFGPHKDELLLELGGYAARGSASQGQHRALTLALKAAETACIAGVRGVEPILLLDDVSSELDGKRTAALFAFLARSRGQIFLTTTRRDLIVTPEIPAADRHDFRLVGGALEP